MERKKLAPNSFQQKVVDFLKENSSKSFTAKEILEETNKRSGKSRSDGSISGTLTVLCEGRWVVKSDEYPSRYSYQNEHSYIEMSVKTLGTPGQPVIDDTSQDYFLQRRISDIKGKVVNIDDQIEQLQRERSFLQGQLVAFEELLLQHK